jgi:radical SAM protein with 4Fe4S-binding SPASM domain
VPAPVELPLTAGPFKRSDGRSAVAVYRLDDKRAVVHHSLLGRPQLVAFDSAEEREAFVSAVHGGPVESGIPALDSILAVDDAEARRATSAQRDKYLRRLPTRISFLSLVISEACNLGCSYCIAGANMAAAAAARTVSMSWETARRAVDWYFATVDPAGEPYVNFTGGEPLLNARLVSQVLAYVRENYAERFRNIRFSINTNATLITPEIARTLKEYAVDVATSLDGTPGASDLVRISKRTQIGVSEKILAGWRELAKAGHPVTGFMATFNDRNYQALNQTVVDFAREMGFQWVRVDCDVIHLLEIPPEEVVEKLWRIYHRGKELGVTVEGFWSTAVHNLLSPAEGQRHASGEGPAKAEFFCGAVSGETVSVHPDGRVSACGFSRARLGHAIKGEMLSLADHLALVRSYFPGERAFCRGCSIEGSCAGGCNIAREESTSSGSDRVIEYNCKLYRELTERLLVDYFADTAPASPD